MVSSLEREKNGDLDMCVRKTVYKIQIKERFMNLSGNLKENFQYENRYLTTFTIGTAKINVDQINARYVEQFTLSMAAHSIIKQ